MPLVIAIMAARVGDTTGEGQPSVRIIKNDLTRSRGVETPCFEAILIDHHVYTGYACGATPKVAILPIAFEI